MYNSENVLWRFLSFLKPRNILTFDSLRNFLRWPVFGIPYTYNREWPWSWWQIIAKINISVYLINRFPEIEIINAAQSWVTKITMKLLLGCISLYSNCPRDATYPDKKYRKFILYYQSNMFLKILFASVAILNKPLPWQARCFFLIYTTF